MHEGIPGLFDGIPGINEAREKAKNGDFIVDTRLGYQLTNDVNLDLLLIIY